MTVLVTGGTGHLGASLVRALIDQGRKVRVLVHRHDRSLEGLEVERIPGDTRDPATLAPAFADVEIVYHLAGCISIMGDCGGQVSEVNVTGTRNVVSACLAHNVRRLVHFSSIHAFDLTRMDRPVTEETGSTRSRCAYDRSKVRGQNEVYASIAAGLDAVIVNPTGVIGPLDFQPSRMGRCLLTLARGKMPMLVPGGFDWVDSRDVALGALAAEQKGRKGERYLLGGEYHTLVEIAHLLGQITGQPRARGVCPIWLARLGAPFMELWGRLTGREPLYTRESLLALRANPRISHDKAAQELGYAPRPFAQTLADTLAWYQQAGQL